ncbi:MAG: 2Fe-2S iron-sulfur cluster-binding protein [Bacteroidia bacterium]|nr:2Fe-2S iron-sulfur cluster-binding protein [Bacteroidia bacterium]
MIIEIEVNGRKIKTQKGELILDTLKANGIHVPTLCNLDGFKPSGACRICVVEVEGRTDLVPSCSYFVEEWMKIHTHSARVIQARKTILELLLSNHDGECLYCDRGRWCKLQDLASELNVTERKFGGRTIRKRIDNTSQSIIRDPAKCILCSRCVRVCEELQVVAALDFLNRGSRTEVGTVLDKGLNYTSCISCGQCIQVCPTGALKEKSHLDQVGILLQNKGKIPVALIDPAVFVTLGEFYGYKAGLEFSSIFISALRRIGFQRVYGTGWGMEYQAGKLASLLKERNPDNSSGPLLLSECPSVVRYICQSRPDLLSSLVPLKPARQLMTHLLRGMISKQTGKPRSDIAIVYLTSCTASKNETCAALKMKEPGYLPDYSLTTREVFRLIRLFGIEVENLNPESQEDIFGIGARSGHLSAISGGYIEMLTRTLQVRMPGTIIPGEKLGKIRVLKDTKETVYDSNGKRLVMSSVSSIAQFEGFLKEIKNKHRKIDLLEVMACQHGCINGGGQPSRGDDQNLRSRLKGILDWDEKYSGIQTRDKLDLPVDSNLSEEDLTAVFAPRLIIK